MMYGPDDPVECQEALASRLDDIYDDLSYGDIKVVNTVITAQFNLDVPLRKLSERSLEISYEPEIEAAARAKFECRCSAAIYNSGSVVLMGAKTEECVINHMRFLSTYMSTER